MEHYFLQNTCFQSSCIEVSNSNVEFYYISLYNFFILFILLVYQITHFNYSKTFCLNIHMICMISSYSYNFLNLYYIVRYFFIRIIQFIYVLLYINVGIPRKAFVHHIMNVTNRIEY